MSKLSEFEKSGNHLFVRGIDWKSIVIQVFCLRQRKESDPFPHIVSIFDVGTSKNRYGFSTTPEIFSQIGAQRNYSLGNFEADMKSAYSELNSIGVVTDFRPEDMVWSESQQCWQLCEFYCMAVHDGKTWSHMEDFREFGYDFECDPVTGDMAVDVASLQGKILDAQ